MVLKIFNYLMYINFGHQNYCATGKCFNIKHGESKAESSLGSDTCFPQRGPGFVGHRKLWIPWAILGVAEGGVPICSMRSRLVPNSWGSPCPLCRGYRIQGVTKRVPPGTVDTKLVMVLILDGNSEKGLHFRSNFCYLICFRHMIRSRAIKSLIFFQKRLTFLHTCATCSKLPSEISTMS